MLTITFKTYKTGLIGPRAMQQKKRWIGAFSRGKVLSLGQEKFLSSSKYPFLNSYYFLHNTIYFALFPYFQ